MSGKIPCQQNKETEEYKYGKDVPITHIINRIKSTEHLERICLLGEPLFQLKATLTLMDNIKANSNLPIWLYTDYRYEALQPIIRRLSDVIVIQNNTTYKKREGKYFYEETK